MRIPRSMAQRIEAMRVLGDVEVITRDAHNYTARVRVEIGGNGFLTATATSAATPALAIEQLWKRLTQLAPDQYLVTDACAASRRHWRWNGRAFTPIPQPSYV